LVTTLPHCAAHAVVFSFHKKTPDFLENLIGCLSRLPSIRLVADVSVSVELAKIAGGISADVVTGPYDVIARVEVDTIDALGKLVVAEIQAVEGITRTLTCPIVRL
jgi:DNA-binding Lrp family transcriptional regulator